MKRAAANNFSFQAKVALIQGRLNVKKLAEKIGHPRPTVSAVINGSDRFPAVKDKVCRALKLTPQP